MMRRAPDRRSARQHNRSPREGAPGPRASVRTPDAGSRIHGGQRPREREREAVILLTAALLRASADREGGTLVATSNRNTRMSAIRDDTAHIYCRVETRELVRSRKRGGQTYDELLRRMVETYDPDAEHEQESADGGV